MRTRDHAKTPPINGIFPLDRDGLCAEAARLYIACLKTGQQCAVLAKAYLDCRKNQNLMTAADHVWAETLRDQSN